MKILKFAIVALIAFGGANAFAQEETPVKTEKKEAKTPQEKANLKINKLTEALELTEEQQVKAKEISERFITRIQAIKADTTIAVETKKAQFKELKKAHKEEIKAILDENQLVKLEQLEAERKAKKEASKKTPEERAEAQTQRMATALDLTEEQIEKVRILNLKVINKIQVIKEDESMTPEKKKEFIKGNKQDHKSVMKSILTDEQFVKYEEYLANRRATGKDKKIEGKQIETVTE